MRWGGRGCCVALWLAIEWPWSALPGPFLTLLAQMGIETTPLTLYGHHFWYYRQLGEYLLVGKP